MHSVRSGPAASSLFLALVAAGCGESSEQPARTGEPAVSPSKIPSAPAAPAPLLRARTDTDEKALLLRGSFEPRDFVITRSRRALDLDGDGRFDLRVVDDGGTPWLECVRPGHLVALSPPPVGLPLSAFLSMTAWAVLAGLAMGEDRGQPTPLATRVELRPHGVIAARVIREELGGAGVVAVLQVAKLECEADAAGLRTLELHAEVHSLGAGEVLVPRLPDAYYEQRMGSSEGVERLFEDARFHHPSLCTFDCIELDRDHLEWSGTSGRDLCHRGAWQLSLMTDQARLYALREGSAPSFAVPEAGGGTLYLPIAQQPGAAGREFLLRRVRSGFERRLWMKIIQVVPDEFCEIAWRDGKASDLATPRVAREREVVILDSQSEPVAGVVVLARTKTAMTTVEIDDTLGCTRCASAESGAQRPLSNSLWTALSDRDGVARVPVPIDVADTEVEWIALELGGTARMARRTGVDFEAGSGSELVMILAEAGKTMVEVELGTDVDPERRIPATLHLRDASARLRLPAHGRIELPALGEVVELWLDPPFAPGRVAIDLVAGASKSLAISDRSNVERRWYPIDAGSGTARLDLSAPPTLTSKEGALRLRQGFVWSATGPPSLDAELIWEDGARLRWTDLGGDALEVDVPVSH